MALLSELCPDPRSTADLLAAVARARGCRTEEEIALFLAEDPPVGSPLARLPAYEQARERIRCALGFGRRIVLFGDYDADGITALAQMHRWLRAAGHPERELRWFVPDRQRHDYGLSAEAAEECLRRHAPSLLLALDCGTASPRAAGMLRDRGVDCVVIDHHALVAPPETHPAAALVNPAAWPESEPARHALLRCSAAGLAFLVCDQLATDLGVDGWDREAGLLLAGLGTVVDVMPLRDLNRALVKQALRAARSGGLPRLPGLAALHEVAGGGAIDARTFAFLWGPRLNAPGRLEDAAHPVDLLLSSDLETARPLARKCHEANRARQELTREIEAEADRMAADRLRRHPEETVLVVGSASWHPGVVGIVAGRLRERYARPAVVCGGHADGSWRGSGRGLAGYDLGAEIRAACEASIVQRGGGHALAAGLQLAPANLDRLRIWLNERSPLRTEDLAPRYEALCSLAPPGLADWSDLPPEEDPRRDGVLLARFWSDVFDRLEPFGAGNPKPGLLLRRGELRWGPQPRTRREDGSTWAMAAGFATGTGRGLLFAEWTDLEAARVSWRRGALYNLVLTPTRSASARAADGRIWHGWRVVTSEPS